MKMGMMRQAVLQFRLLFLTFSALVLAGGAALGQNATPHPVPPADIPQVKDVEPLSGVEEAETANSTDSALPLSPKIAKMTMQITVEKRTAVEAAGEMALLLDGAGGGVSRDELLAAWEDAAEAGQPMALWRLGTMYENGEGVEKDAAKAFSYFQRIANDNANTPPRSVEADIVAQSFVKMGQYYREGIPSAGVPVDVNRSNGLLLHAASYFGDAEAQYQVGHLFLEKDGLGVNTVQGARWLSLAARKGHVGAQADLGDLLFNGEGESQQKIEGLMWLTVAQHRARGTAEQTRIDELAARAMSVATPDQRQAAIRAADQFGPRFGGY